MKSLKTGIILIGLLAFTPLASAQNANLDQANMGQMDRSDMAAKNSVTAMEAEAPIIVAKVNGMVCDFCAQALKKVFKKEAAVEDLSVDLDASEVTITLKSGQTLSDDKVETLIRKSGYAFVSAARDGGA